MVFLSELFLAQLFFNVEYTNYKNEQMPADTNNSTFKSEKSTDQQVTVAYKNADNEETYRS